MTGSLVLEYQLLWHEVKLGSSPSVLLSPLGLQSWQWSWLLVFSSPLAPTTSSLPRACTADGTQHKVLPSRSLTHSLSSSPSGLVLLFGRVVLSYGSVPVCDCECGGCGNSDEDGDGFPAGSERKGKEGPQTSRLKVSCLELCGAHSHPQPNPPRYLWREVCKFWDCSPIHSFVCCYDAELRSCHGDGWLTKLDIFTI